eukprot:TRINITY_DN467_c0_g1_i1.p1 TRINITY_DN467_c0_g1~~TRINITY_DN467_c0_g1_i1.p1  ORF type:complete len:149 (+),score=12.22 TRINITY_DN467_c0_g1_i1:59-448(+)
MMKIMLAIVFALVVAHCYADYASATSGSSATNYYGRGCASTHTDTSVSGQGSADADADASVITPWCLVTASSDSYTTIYNYCSVQIADAFADAFAGGSYPYADVSTWASNNGYYCTIFASADAFTCAFC